MALRKVAVMGHPVLRQVALPIPSEEIALPKIQGLIQDMIETMMEYDGRGLAAPQVHESLQLVIMIWDFEPEKKPYLLVLINPELKATTAEESEFWEGCLSVPGLRGKVSRPNLVTVNYLNAKGEPKQLEATGFAATVLQHECDHLLGKLYLDRMTDLSTLAYNREQERYLSDSDE